MADKLTLYNIALGHLRESRLASLTENREPRRVLDSFYDQAVQEAIEAGLWKFMLRAIEEDASTTLKPAFGWTYAFVIPSDWIRTVMVCSDETFNQPLPDFMEEAGVWYANSTPLFVRYISNDPNYGGNLGTWTASFTKYVSLLLAEYSCGRITGSTTLLEGAQGISARLKVAKREAKANDAMNESAGIIPVGTWVRSRRGFIRGNPAPGGVGGFDDD